MPDNQEENWIKSANSPVLRGIGGVKAPNSISYVTPEQAAFYAKELKRCKEDPIYFAEKYFTIISFKGKEKIKLFEKQKEMLLSFLKNPFTICLSARQSGKCLDGSTSIVVRNKKTGEIKMKKIGEFYDELASQSPN